jgi:5-methylcytosine-specific restriction endonuclease McrA
VDDRGDLVDIPIAIGDIIKSGRECRANGTSALTKSTLPRSIKVANEIITRTEAAAQGLKRFFCGTVCKHGHCAERYVNDGKCVSCVASRAAIRTKRWAEKNRERRCAISREWKQRNRDHSRNLTREWRKRNPEAGKLWHVNNREQSRINVRNRYARKMSAPGSHTSADLAAILKAQSYRCAYCRSDLRKAKRHVDHIQPLARGGSNGRANLQYLCAPCNFAKGARDPVEFAQELGRLL